MKTTTKPPSFLPYRTMSGRRLKNPVPFCGVVFHGSLRVEEKLSHGGRNGEAIIRRLDARRNFRSEVEVGKVEGREGGGGLEVNDTS